MADVVKSMSAALNKAAEREAIAEVAACINISSGEDAFISGDKTMQDAWAWHEHEANKMAALGAFA